MKRIIICEGKTDAILISYFLIKRFGWEYIGEKSPKSLGFQLSCNRDNEVLKWYKHPEKPDQELVIWGAGGIEQIPIKLGHVVELTGDKRTPEGGFVRIVLFFDRDNRSGDDCAALVGKWIAEDDRLEIVGALALGQWIDARIKLRKSPEEVHKLSILPIALPTDSQGNLEVFLTNSIREQSEGDEQLVDEARKFIELIPDEPYLNKKRYRPKACLGSVLSVMSSDWGFLRLDDQLKKVRWEEIESVEAVYGNLSEL